MLICKNQVYKASAERHYGIASAEQTYETNILHTFFKRRECGISDSIQTWISARVVEIKDAPETYNVTHQKRFRRTLSGLYHTHWRTVRNEAITLPYTLFTTPFPSVRVLLLGLTKLLFVLWWVVYFLVGKNTRVLNITRERKRRGGIYVVVKEDERRCIFCVGLTGVRHHGDNICPIVVVVIL